MVKGLSRVLILEDEDGIRSFINVNLKRNGFEVVEASTGEEALKKIENEKNIDVAVLDVMLPGISGFDVCRKLRDKYPDMGIIMLTAKSQEADKVEGFETGADDYVVKPFSCVELIARINSLLRRINRLTEDKNVVITAGNLKLDIYTRKFFKDETEIDLTPKEFSIMKLLMENKGATVSRDEILDMVWGKNYFGDLKVVEVNIRRIRKKLEDDFSDPFYIETVWGYGYRLKGE